MMQEAKVVCQTCLKVHGRDTNAPVECPYCHKLIGCFWHRPQVLKHMRQCKEKP
jgi:hypothetical protein